MATTEEIRADLAEIVNEVAGIDADDVQLDKSFVDDLDEPTTDALGRLSAGFAVYRREGDLLRPVPLVRPDRFDDDLRTQIEQMGQIMEDSLGIGLAATQVGKLQRVLVYRVEPDSPVNAVVNPEIEWSGDELETAEEGCLSLQGVLVDVERPVFIRVRAQDEHGEPITIEARRAVEPGTASSRIRSTSAREARWGETCPAVGMKPPRKTIRSTPALAAARPKRSAAWRSPSVAPGRCTPTPWAS